MRRRPNLERTGAGVLVALAIVAVEQASTLGDARPLQARPLVGAVTQPNRAIVRPVEPVHTPAPPGPVAMIPPGRPTVRVPILMYHYIRVNPNRSDRLGFNLSVTPADFSRQMDWLAANGYHPVDFDDVRGYLLGQEDLPSRPVVLTFDDGYRDMYTTAFPILRSHRFKAVSYIVSGFVNSPQYVTADQVREMDVNGIQIGAHTVSHADLTGVSAPDLRREVFDSKASLEALVGHPVLDFCYPTGRFNDAVVRMVQEAGFQTATTTQSGVAHSAAERFAWTRVRASGGESLEQFISDLGQPEPSIIGIRSLKHRGLQRKVTFPLEAPPTAPVEGSPDQGPTP